MTQPTFERRLKVLRLLILLVGSVLIAGGAYGLHQLQTARLADAYLPRAKSESESGNHTKAAEHYQAYLKFHPKNAEVLGLCVEELEQASQTESGKIAAILHYSELLLGVDPSRDETRWRLVKHYLTVKDYNGARNHIARLRTAPLNNKIGAELDERESFCEEREERLPQAIELLKKALQAEPNRKEWKLRLASLDLRRSTVESLAEATEILDDLARTSPNDLDVRLARATHFLQAKRRPEAWKELEFAGKNLPDAHKSEPFVLALSSLASSADEWNFAKSILDRAVLQSPGNNRYKIALSNLQLRMNDLAGAKQTLATANLEAGGKPNQELLGVAERLLDLGEPEAARTAAERFASDSKASFISDYLKGRLKLYEGNWPEAISLITKSLANGLEKESALAAKAHLVLSDCYALADNPDLRFQEVQSVLALDPNNSMARLARAELLARSGRTQEAIGIYAELTELPTARLALSRLRLNEELKKTSDQKWSEIDLLFGQGPLTNEMMLLKAESLFARKQERQAFEVLEFLVTDKPEFVGGWIALAFANAATKPGEGLAILDRAEKALGDLPEIRLARVRMLASTRVPTTTILAFADPAKLTTLSPHGRGKYLCAIANTLLQMGDRKGAIDCLARAVKELPYDLSARVALFETALFEKQTELALTTEKEIEALDGPDGPVRIAVEVQKKILELKPGDRAVLGSLRDRLKVASTKRDSWGKLAILRGDIELLAGNGDGAYEHYRRAFEQGEISEALIRSLLQLATERQNHSECLAILNAASRRGILPTDLDQKLVILRATYGETPESTLAWADSENVAKSTDIKCQLTRATVYVTAGKLPEAKKALEFAVGLEGSTPDAWYALVRFLASTGELTAAKETAERAQKKWDSLPDQPEERANFALALGGCCELVGKIDQAESYYRTALAAVPNAVESRRRLVNLLVINGKRKEAEAVLESAIREGPLDLKRWGRRTLATAKVSIDPPDVVGALALVDANIQESDSLEDRRLRAILQSADPFGLRDAIKTLTESAKTAPLNSDQLHMLARMHLRQGEMVQAENRLIEATRGSLVANPSDLALLAKLQVRSLKLQEARKTVARLIAVAPVAWGTAVESARLAAAEGRKEEAFKGLLQSALGQSELEKITNPPENFHSLLTTKIAPQLEEFGMAAEAESLYRAAATRTSTANAHIALIDFLIRSGRVEDALPEIRKREKNTPVPLTAKLLSVTCRSRPLARTKETEREAWALQLKEIDAWLETQLKERPSDRELLSAKADLLDAFGKYDEEIALYERLIENTQKEKAEQYSNNLAMLLALHKKEGSQKSLGLVNDIVTRRGPLPTLLDTRAIVHIVGERPLEAIRDLDAAITREPKAVYYFHRALAYDRIPGETPENLASRDANFREALKLGLKIEQLHAKEDDDFQRLSKVVKTH